MRIGKILVLIVLMLFAACNGGQKLVVEDLKCENLQNPSGIDKTVPRFSWKIRSMVNGTTQTAFEILVASDREKLKKNQADLWESGKVDSESPIWVEYNGKTLSSGEHAYWKVRVWDENGTVSGWSQMAEFGIGLLNTGDWKADYIAFNTEAGYRECPQFYKSFEVKERDKELFLHVNSLGYHEVYINGKKVGEGVLTPAVSQFDKRSLVNTYNVSDYVEPGQNDLLIWLGSGWYTTGFPGVVNNGPVVRAQLEQVENCKRDIILKTDSSWKGRKSSYTRFGNWLPHHFGGEILNGDWAKSDLRIDNVPGRIWSKVSVIDVPNHNVSPQMVELNQLEEIIFPQNIRETGKGIFLIDMGKNLTGWTEIRFSGLEKSQEIVLNYCDHLSEDGKFVECDQYDKYIASGTGPEVFINKFNYHGFRYIQISGMRQMPVKDSVKAYLVHTAYELASDFECSDPDLNKIHNMLFYTLRCLSLGGDLVDCPQIERMGYGGDGNASTITAQTMFNLGPLYTNWLQVWGDVIREDGGMPHTAPSPYKAGGGPFWCGFIVAASWNTFLNYGDTLLLRKYYPVMQKWLGYVEKYSVDGLLRKWPDTEYRGWYLGDWAAPKGVDQTEEASVDVVNNSFIVMCYDNMERISNVIGKTEDQDIYAQKKAALRNRINDVFFDPQTNTYGTGTQIDLAFPLIAGVVPEGVKEAVTESFYEETEVNCSGHFACGLVGLPVVTRWAVENKASNLMYSMFKKRDYPGYLYIIDNGATTTWEQWGGERSYIHNCYNGTGSWFYQAIGGIRLADDVPAYRRVRIEPLIPDGITWAKTSRETPFGKLTVNWELSGNQINMYLEIPVGTDAEIILPEDAKEFRLDGEVYKIENVSPGIVDLKSGKYTIEYEEQTKI